jgi:PGF-CTERM protein
MEQGETATINLSLSGLDGITVLVGGGQAAYELNATVTDGSGDGRVVLLFDTSKAGSGDGAALTTKADADSLTVKNGTKLDGSLGTGMYGITVYNGTSENVSAIAHGGLNVQGDGTTDGTTTTDDGSADETTTTIGDTTTMTERDGQPGFGVGLAVAALTGVALLVRRR